MYNIHLRGLFHLAQIFRGSIFRFTKMTVTSSKMGHFRPDFAQVPLFRPTPYFASKLILYALGVKQGTYGNIFHYLFIRK